MLNNGVKIENIFHNQIDYKSTDIKNLASTGRYLLDAKIFYDMKLSSVRSWRVCSYTYYI